MHQSTFDRLLTNEMKKLAKIKMLTIYLNKLFESNVQTSVLFLCNCTRRASFSYVENKPSSCPFKYFYPSNEGDLQICPHLNEVLTKFLEDVLNCIDNSTLLNAINSFINTFNERQMCLDNIRIPYETEIGGKRNFNILMEHASMFNEMRSWSFVPWNPITFCYLLIQESIYTQILRDALPHGTRQTDIRKTTKNSKTNTALQVILKSQGALPFTLMHTNQKVQIDLNKNQLSGIAAFEDLLSSIKLEASTASNTRIVAHGNFSKLPDFKRQHNRSKLDMLFGGKNMEKALASYPIKFTHIADILMSTSLSKRILVTASGALTSDTVIAGRRKKHFSQAFMGYLSPEYSEKYTSKCSKSVSIAGALNAIKNYLRRRKEEYYLKKAANTKKRTALLIEHTSYTLTQSSDVFEKAGYGFYCF